MTIRWKPGKEPTKADIKQAITNAISCFISNADVDKITDAIHRLYKDRIERRN